MIGCCFLLVNLEDVFVDTLSLSRQHFDDTFNIYRGNEYAGYHNRSTAQTNNL